jgi:hypothetical protein
MKLYTEEQMHSVILLALGRHGIYIPNKHYQDLIDLLTPIEIPSDEEVDDRSYSDEQEKGFRNGAKWMRNKIQGDNK